MSATHAPLLSVGSTASAGSRIARQLLIVLAGTAILTLSAKIQVPFWPVPMTMQPYVVLVLGMALGTRLAAATVLLYLIEGMVGWPVFAGTPEKGIGIAYMMGPTGGYLLGFLAAATVTGWLAERGWDRRPLTALAASLLGMTVIYALGLAWLATLIGFGKAWAFGAMPFLPGDGLKVLLATATLPVAWQVRGRLSR